MHALDTNVLVRFLVRDDEAQYVAARACLQAAVTRAEPLFVPDPVLCELVWVLDRTYRGDFPDYLIRERALSAGCDAVVTFDRALHREPGFVAPA